MLESLPQSIWNELHQARSEVNRRQSRLRVEANGDSYPILRLTPEGFVLDAAGAPKNLRGLVDLFDGGRHLSRCLIVAASEESGQIVYDFKRNTMADRGAPLDFVRDEHAPAALIDHTLL